MQTCMHESGTLEVKYTGSIHRETGLLSCCMCMQQVHTAVSAAVNKRLKRQLVYQCLSISTKHRTGE